MAAQVALAGLDERGGDAGALQDREGLAETLDLGLASGLKFCT